MQTKNEKEQKSNISFISLNSKKIDTSQLKTILKQSNNHGLCGSVNLGNTCYMNSSIACIQNCTELTTFFLTKEYKKYKNTSNKNGLNGKLADEWYDLLDDYWKSSKQYGNPKKIKNLVAKKYKKFEDFEQQDANEFIIIFLELLSEDLNTIKKSKYLEIDIQHNNETDIQCAKRFWDFHYSRNNSIIMDLFCGLNKSIITCPICNFKSITYIPFISLSLLIPNLEKLKKIRYQNFPLIDINIYYIPKYSLTKTYKINIRIKKNSSYKEILNQIKEKIEDFPFTLDENSIDIIEVNNRKIEKIINLDNICEGENYYTSHKFFIEKDLNKNINNMIYIPIYIKIGDEYSSYPRAIYVYEGMTYYELKTKLYILIRKYFLAPKKLNETKVLEISKKLKTINSEYNYSNLSDLPELIEKEFNIYNNSKESIEFPYKILIQKNLYLDKSSLIFDGQKDFFDNLSIYEINSNKSNIDILTVNLQNFDVILVLNILTENKKFRKSIAETVDDCVVLNSDDYCEKNFLNENSSKITLDDCFNLFRMEEYLEEGNEYFCKNCKNKVNAKKKLDFFYLPKILCVSISRFQKKGDNYSKNDKLVEFPITDLNMNQYIINKDDNNQQNYIYDAFAVSEHYGSRYGGHYTAICKNFDNKWYSYDDSDCSQADEKDVCTRNAYVIFYRRRDW